MENFYKWQKEQNHKVVMITDSNPTHLQNAEHSYEESKHPRGPDGKYIEKPYITDDKIDNLLPNPTKTDKAEKVKNFGKEGYDEAVSYRNSILENMLGYPITNREFSTQNKNKQKGGNQNESIRNKYSDEFRRIQAESTRLSEDTISNIHRRIPEEIDTGLRESLSDVFSRELVNTCGGNSNNNVLLTNKATKENFRLYKDVDGELFHDILKVVRNYLPNGDAVTLHDADYYKGTRNFLADNGLAGFSITSTGDVVSVFSMNKGFLYSVRDAIIEQGGLTLDCFNSEKQPLPEIYKKTLGFIPASSLDFNREVIANDAATDIAKRYKERTGQEMSANEAKSKGEEYGKWFESYYGEAPVVFMYNPKSVEEAKKNGWYKTTPNNKYWKQ